MGGGAKFVLAFDGISVPGEIWIGGCVMGN